MLARRVMRTLSGLFPLALLLAGCTSQDPPVARIGSATITQSEFQQVARGNVANFPGDPATARQQLLDNLVRRQLMIEAARASGLDTLAPLRARREQIEETVASQALAAQLAPPDVRVSDAEVEHFYDLRRTVCDVSVIHTSSRAFIEQARLALDRGEPFASVADRFNGLGLLPPGGAVGEMTYGSLLPPLDDAMLRLAQGRIGGPYETPSGWFLLRVNQRRENTALEPFAQQRAGLTEMIRQRKVRSALSAGLEGLRRDYEVTLAPDAPARLFEALTPFRQGRDDAQGPPASDRLQVLASWRGGFYTLGDAWKDLARDDRQKPPYESTDGLRAWLENMAVHRVALQEARARHLIEEPAAKRRLRADWENALLEAEFEGMVAQIPPASEADARALWEAQRATPGGAQLPAYDALPPPQRARVVEMASQAARDQALERATDALMARERPEIHAERLAALPWPPPAAIDVGGW